MHLPLPDPQESDSEAEMPKRQRRVTASGNPSRAAKNRQLPIIDDSQEGAEPVDELPTSRSLRCDANTRCCRISCYFHRFIRCFLTGVLKRCPKRLSLSCAKLQAARQC